MSSNNPVPTISSGTPVAIEEGRPGLNKEKTKIWNPSIKPKPPAQYHALAGIGAGVIGTMITHPLDLVKTRFQVQRAGGKQGLYTGTWDAFRKILATEGRSALWKGLSGNLIGSSSSWGVYFFVYQGLKNKLLPSNTSSSNSSLVLGLEKNVPMIHFVAAVNAGVITSLVTHPIWTIKTRLQLVLPSGQGKIGMGTHSYTGFIDAFSKTLKREGISGLYAGIGMSMVGVSHGVFQFMAYEQVKRGYQISTGSQQLSWSQYLITGAVAKMFASIASYPYQVVRARLQDETASKSQKSMRLTTRGVIKQIYRVEGLAGFYAGLTANVLRTAPNAAITFMAYELILQSLWNPDEKT